MATSNSSINTSLTDAIKPYAGQKRLKAILDRESGGINSRATASVLWG
jgi:hypothetical protein